MSVIEEIQLERNRQISKEGWSKNHDDSHNDGAMAKAAACYAIQSAAPVMTPAILDDTLLDRLWPWSRKWWKPKNPRRDLIRAGALIVAEIERLDRKNG